MKKLILVAVIAVIGFTANAQTTKKENKKEKTGQMQMKDHVCTSACKDGKHAYAHGEKGHVCSEDCKKMMNKETAMKDHVCTSACKNGKHVYAHGEKGHVCGEECKKMMK